MKLTNKIKFTALHTLLLLLPASLFAADEVKVQTKVFESNKSIPHDLVKLSKMKGVDIMTTPDIITKSGEKVNIETNHKLQPVGIAPIDLKPITIKVTPTVKDGKISYTAQYTISKKINNKSVEGQTRTEITSRDLYVSGISTVGEELWFDYLDPNSSKKITVLMLLTTK
jgi:hypothetical protein